MGDVDEAGEPVAGPDGGGVAATLGLFEDVSDHVDRPIPRPTDEQYAATARQFTVPDPTPIVEALDYDRFYRPMDTLRLPRGSFLLDTSVGQRTDEAGRIFVRFDGPASLRFGAEQTTVTLDEAGSVALGVRTRDDDGPARLQVPATLPGVAAGLSALSAAHCTETPARSHPDRRRHPPLMTVGDTLSVPESVVNRRQDTGIELRVPASIDALFVVAPLCFYLGATLSVEPRDTVLLTAEGTSIRHEFSRLPALQDEVATVLRRVFFLDCHLRRDDPARGATELLETADVDPSTVRDLSLAGRLERYLDVATESIGERLPDWHLSTHVQPSLQRVRCLPFLLDRLSLVYIADRSELCPKDLLDRTLADAYPTRGSATDAPGVLAPEFGAGRTHAWLAPGTPIDAFKTTPRAFENRFLSRETAPDPVDVTVVRNDEQMTDEHRSVADIYRDAPLSMDVAVEERLTTTALAAAFETESDFVHFVGHCDEDGLRCPDGALSLDRLTDPATRTFFLNACGSYDEGVSLVEHGAVGGAVTFTDVLDDHAVQVGTAFAKLVGHGFCLQRALELARRRIMMGKDYTVVGDGTYALGPGDSRPTVLWLSESDGAFELACEVTTPQSAGLTYSLPVDGERVLNGTRRTFTVDAATLHETLSEASVPVVYGGDLFWSDDLLASLDVP